MSGALVVFRRWGLAAILTGDRMSVPEARFDNTSFADDVGSELDFSPSTTTFSLGKEIAVCGKVFPSDKFKVSPEYPA